MMMLVAYDVSVQTAKGRRRLRRVAKTCQSWGQRVQNSVFECLVDPAQWEQLREKLISEINPETDSLRFYRLGKHWKNRIEHVGAKEAYDPTGPMIV